MVVRNGKFATQVAVACLLALPNVFNPSFNVLPLKNSGKQENRYRFVFGVQDGIFVSSEAGRIKGGPCSKVASRYEEIIFNQPIEQITMLISLALGVRTESLSKQQHAHAVYSMTAESFLQMVCFSSDFAKFHHLFQFPLPAVMGGLPSLLFNMSFPCQGPDKLALENGP